MAAYTESYGAGGADAWLLKLDAAGDTVWTRTYGGGDEDYLGDVALLSNGDYLFVGSSYSFGTLADVLVIRTDEGGDPVWTETHGGSGYQWGEAVCVTTDGDYVIAGTSSGGGFSDVYIVRVDSSGDMVWEQTYGGPYEDCAADICQTQDGGFMIVGTTNSNGAPWSDMYVIKTDANGDSVWTATFGSSGWDGWASICRTFDDYYVVAGYYQDATADVFLVNLDTDGNAICSNVVYGPDHEEARSICETSNAGFIVAGSSDAGANQ